MERTKFKGRINLKVEVVKSYELDGRIVLEFCITKKTSPTNIYYNTKTLLAISKNEVPSIQKKTHKFLPLAKLLANIIQTNKNVNLTKRQILQWANEIRKLSEIHHIDYERIKKALYWYKKNIGGQYIPIIESGYSLKNKFQSLEAAIERSEKPFTTSNKPSVIYDDGIKYTLGKDGRYRNHAGAIYIE